MIEYICSFEEEHGFLVSASMKYGEELIRCKDCKYSVEEYNDGECYCDYNGCLSYIKDWHHYCGWGERREE